MAEEFLEPIYKEADILWKLRQVVEWAKVLDDHHAFMHYNMLVSEIGELCGRYSEYDEAKGRNLYQVAKGIAQEKSLIIIGDKIEYELIPCIEECISRWGMIDAENEEGDYKFETTVSGFLTIKNMKDNNYFHSIVDPMWEARKQVEYMYNPQKASYSVLGCGLGYFIYQLYVISEGSIVINVYEKDERMVEYAKSYGVLDWIPEECINIIINEDSFCFLQSADDENVGFHMLPFVLDSEPEDMRAVLMCLYTEFCTGKIFERSMDINFYRNIQSDCKPVGDFDVSKLKEEFIVIAAGPSLDEDMEFLRENKGKRTLIAVGTVFKKLLDAHIEPDIVVVVDPQKRTIKQIEGREDSSVPILIAMTAFWKFASTYKGEKYLVPLAQTKEMIQYSIDHKLKLWSCSGTVTSLAVEAAIQFGAKAIYLVGVDLAYPNGISHAEGTMDRTIKSTEYMQPVEGVNNQTVYSTDVFNTYRKGIEERIAQTPQITYYNMSRIGSRIAGTKEIMDWKNMTEGADE